MTTAKMELLDTVATLEEAREQYDRICDIEPKPSNAKALAILREYAGLKLFSVKARVDGQVDRALQYERKMDRVYSRIQETAQW